MGLITTAEAAVILRVTPGRVRQLIRDRQLKSEKRGRDHLLDQTEVERFDQLPWRDRLGVRVRPVRVLRPDVEDRAAGSR